MSGTASGVVAGLVTSGHAPAIGTTAAASGDSGRAGSGASGSPFTGAERASGISVSAKRAGSDHHGGFTSRYLNRVVAHFEGCLSVIGSRDANVLTLRTGWGINRSYGRRAVARILHVSLKREGQLEHQAVSALGSATKRGSCGGAQQANRSALFLSPSELSLLGSSLPRAFVSSAGGSDHAGNGQRSPAGRRKSSVSAASTGGVPGTIPSLPHPGTSSFPWLFVIIGIVLATALASPLARRRWLRPRTAGDRIPAAAPRRPGAGVSRRVAERAGAVGAAAAAGAGAVGSQREQEPKREPAEPDGDAVAASSLGARLEREGDIDGATAAYRRADERGDPTGSTNLGVILEQRGDLEGAVAAYRRADERGDANGSFNLGCLLADLGDTAGALRALKRADERGDPAGSSNLGVLLEQQGDSDGALAAYRRADERGDANGSFNLGLLLANRGDIDGAQDAYRRAAHRGDPTVAERVRSAMAELTENGGELGSGGG